MKQAFSTFTAKLLSLLLVLGLLFSSGLPAIAETADKVVNIGVTDSLGTLNPLLQDGGELNKYATGLMFLPLVELDSGLNFEGALAESITTEDNLTFTVKLYENATWSDGVPVTADDVIFTVLRLTSQSVGNTTMSGYSAIVGFDDSGFSPDDATGVDGIVKVDDHT
ncbi:MAG: ABC transporter substrate-binding protein, partial [Eubacteriales bacterium]|nr:ABC transporter substrate-binding protein [Eubacteriales bacterium]